MIVASLPALSTLAACSRATPPSDRIAVFVGIPPLADLVQRVGGEHVSVEVLVGPGQSPHAFSPTPRQAVRLSHARLYLAIGVDFEAGLIPKLRSETSTLEIVDLRAGIALRPLEDGYAHGPTTDRVDEAGASDPHVWLDPRRAIQIAKNISAALKRAKPDRSADFERNLAALSSELEQLDRSIRSRLADCAGREFVVVHPAYGYFAEAYGLRQRAIEAHGAAPGGRGLSATIDHARACGVRVIFYDPVAGDASAAVVADILGVRSEPLDPLPRDYVAGLREITDRIGRAWAEGAP